MPVIGARCPRCRHVGADLVRERDDGERIQHLVCRACAFDWALIERSAPFRRTLALVYSRPRES